MRNILHINASEACELLCNSDNGENTVILQLPANVQLELDGTMATVPEDGQYTIPAEKYAGTGALRFRLVCDGNAGEYISISKVPEVDGNLCLSRTGNLNYELKTILPRSDVGVPIATNTSLGVVKGGDNVDIAKNGTLRANQSGIERITNTELDEICK